MDPDNNAKGKSRFDLTDVMSILDGGESAKIDDTIDEEPQGSPEPEVKISIVTLPAANEKEEQGSLPAVIEKEELQVVPEAMAPAVKAPEKIAVAEHHAQAKANNELSAKLLADMDQKNAEILKLKSDFMALQYKLNDKDYQIKEKDMNMQGMSAKLSDTQNKLETQKKQNKDLQRQHDDLHRQLESQQRQNDDLHRQSMDLQRQVSDLQRQLDSQQRQNADLQKQLESQQRLHEELQKQYDVVKAELDEINEDKAKVMTRAQAHKLKKSDGYSASEETQAEPAEDDVAAIFKRLTQDKPDEGAQPETPANGQPQENVPSMDRPQPPRKLKTAKLYDL